MKLTTLGQIGKPVRVETFNGTYYGTLIEEHARNFKGGCIDIGVKGEVAVFTAGGKIKGFRQGMRKQSIPASNIIRVVMVRKT